MEFHEMKRKDLQALCKKHGVPANLKNSEMATRLASLLLQKESEEIVMESNVSCEDSVEDDEVKVKKVSFSPETEVFEFTRSVKKRRQTKNVVRSRRSQGPAAARDLRQVVGGVEPRRSKRLSSSDTVQEGSEVTEVKDMSKGNVKDGSEVVKVGRRSTRLVANVPKSNRLVETDDKEDVTVEETEKHHGRDDAKVEKVTRRSKRFVNGIYDQSKEERKSKKSKGSVNSEEGEALVVCEVKSTEKCGSTKAELVTRRSKRHLSKVNVPLVDENVEALAPKQSRRLGKSEPLIDYEVQPTEMISRRSIRQLKNVDVPLCDEKVEAVEVEKAPQQSKRLGKSGPLINCKVQSTEMVTRRSKRPLKNVDVPLVDEKVEAVEVEKAPKQSRRSGKSETSIDCEVQSTEMVTRRSKRQLKNVDVPLVAENVKAVEIEKAPKQSRQLAKIVSELDSQARKGDKKLKRTSGNDHEDIKLLRRSKRSALDNTMGQAMSNSPRRCSVVDSERDGVSIDKESNDNDEMEVRVGRTRKYLKNDSHKAAKVAIQKKDVPLVKSSKRVAGRMKQNKQQEHLDEQPQIEQEFIEEKPQGIDEFSPSSSETKAAESVTIIENVLDSAPETAGGDNVEARCSSKKSQTMIQECIENKPQGVDAYSPSSIETRATESVMIIENVLDSSLEKLVDSSQKANTQELDSELMEGEREEKLEPDTVLMAVLEEEKEDQSLCLPPSPEQLAVSSPEAEVLVPTSDFVLEDIASTMNVHENTKTKEETFITSPTPELSVATIVEEATLENSAECLKEIHLSKEDRKGSLEKEVEGASLHGNFPECNTGNSKAEEEMDISKVGCMSVGYCANQTPENLADEYANLEEDEGGAYVEATGSSEKMKNVHQELACDSPSISETKATEPVMVSEDVFDSALKVSDDTSRARSTQELNSELLETDYKGKHEQDSVLIAGDKEKEDIFSAVITEDDIETKDEPLISTHRSELKEHGSVSKLAKAEAIPETHSSNDDEKDSLQNDSQAANLPENFSECNTENVSAEEQVEISKLGCISGGQCVNLQTQDMVKGESISECFEKDKMKALSQPLPVNKARAVDESALFTTPERNLLLMEQVSENGKTCAADSVTQHNDEAVESSVVAFTTPEQVLLMGDALIDKAGKEEDHRTSDIPDVVNTANTSLLLGGSGNHKALDEGEKTVLKLQNRYALLENSVPDVVEKSGGNRLFKFCEEPVVFIGLEEFLPEGSHAEKAAQSTSKQSRAHSPHADSANPPDFDIEGTETAMEAEINVSLVPYVLALPANGTTCETTGEASNILKVAETCSILSGEGIDHSTNIQNQITDALEELAITDNNDAEELVEPKATNSTTQSLLAGRETGHLGCNSEEGFRNTCEKNGLGETGPIEKASSLTPNQEANAEMTKIEAEAEATTPSPEQPLNINGTSNLSEKEVKREPVSIYTTQVKPKRPHDMKENATNSKIVVNLNVTAPRTTSKRQPLQDLKWN